MTAEELISEIFHCPNCVENKNCPQNSTGQKVQPFINPEPFLGDIANSKILVISETPLIYNNEVYPSKEWAEDEIIDFFKNRFDKNKKYVKEYRYIWVNKKDDKPPADEKNELAEDEENENEEDDEEDEEDEDNHKVLTDAEKAERLEYTKQLLAMRAEERAENAERWAKYAAEEAALEKKAARAKKAAEKRAAARAAEDAKPEVYAHRSILHWSSIRKTVAKIYGRSVDNVIPGADYAMTEIVHCKTKETFCKNKPHSECADRYLDKLVGVSGAKVILVVGAAAEKIVRRRYHIANDKQKVKKDVEINGRKFDFIFIANPCSFPMAIDKNHEIADEFPYFRAKLAE
jgi:uracil-DNA glycosylase